MARAKHVLLKSPQDILSGLVCDVCEAVDSPRSLAVWLLFSNNEHNQLLGLECDPLRYDSASSFADDYLVTSFLSKYPGLSTGIDTKAKAMESFFAFEEQCRDTNRNLKSRLHSRERVAQIFWAASEKCKRWLPALSDPMSNGLIPIEEVFNNLSWGPGVTSSVKGRSLSAYDKFRGKLEITANLQAAGGHYVVNSVPMWGTYHTSGNPDNPSSVTPRNLTVVPGNAVATVPKNAKTERTIAVEPHVNAFLQRGIGIVMRDLLKSRGIDLRSQERNQYLAKKGSRSGSLATLDLKGASDTISLSLVEMMLPRDWFLLLMSCRSSHYRNGNEWSRYHKFSSMGNGYTFELETLIFATLAFSTCNFLGLPTTDISVYGDDVVIPVEAVSLYEEVLETCGFTVNRSKSFSSGPFRESCGKDFFRGINVRPFFVRRELRSLEAIYSVANNLRRYCAMRCSDLGYDRRFLRAWKGLYLAVHPDYRYRIPSGYGDGGFVSELDESQSFITRSKSDINGSWWIVRYWGFTPVTELKVDATLSVASALYDMERQRSGSRWSPMPPAPSDRTRSSKRETGKWRERTMKIYSWPYCGGWV